MTCGRATGHAVLWIADRRRVTQRSGDRRRMRSRRRGCTLGGCSRSRMHVWPGSKPQCTACRKIEIGGRRGWRVDRMSPAIPERVARLILSVQAWAAARPDVLGVALVGSHARGAATPESDVDLVIVCASPTDLIGEPRVAEPYSARRGAPPARTGARDLAARVVCRRPGGRVWDRRSRLGVGAVGCRHAAGDRGRRASCCSIAARRSAGLFEERRARRRTPTRGPRVRDSRSGRPRREPRQPAQAQHVRSGTAARSRPWRRRCRPTPAS